MSGKLEEQFPAIASWILHGSIEIGDQELSGFVATAHDCGGMVVETKPASNRRTLDECMELLEKELRVYMKERWGDEF